MYILEENKTYIQQNIIGLVFECRVNILEAIMVHNVNHELVSEVMPPYSVPSRKEY